MPPPSPDIADAVAPATVQLNGIHKRYGKGPLILEDINLQIKKSEFISLIGPSGCGKSTVLKLIAGLSPITEGELVVDGLSPENAREELAFVFQDANLLPWKRVFNNVELPLKLRGDEKSKRAETVDKLLETVGLADVKNHFPWQLSGGMRMRVSIARALALSPKILLLDEPFGALDEMTRDRLNEELLLTRELEKWTAFFVTHSVAEAVFLSSRVVVLSANPGRVADVIDIPLPFPRKPETRETLEYQELVVAVTKSLRSVM